MCCNDPKIFGNECGDFPFFFDKDAKCRRLNAPGGESVAKFFPNESREIVADEAIQNAPCFLGATEVLID